MITLGIDTSNYATSVALLDNDKHEVLFAAKRFLTVEQGKLGLRQQQALFEHIKNLTDIFSNLEEKDIGAIGVSVRPRDEENSYMPCFLAGKMAAHSVSWAKNVPVIESSHQTGHLTSALFDINKEELYNKELLMLHVSGGLMRLPHPEHHSPRVMSPLQSAVLPGPDSLPVSTSRDLPGTRIRCDIRNSLVEGNVTAVWYRHLCNVLGSMYIHHFHKMRTVNHCIQFIAIDLNVISYVTQFLHDPRITLRIDVLVENPVIIIEIVY